MHRWPHFATDVISFEGGPYTSGGTDDAMEQLYQIPQFIYDTALEKPLACEHQHHQQPLFVRTTDGGIVISPFSSMFSGYVYAHTLATSQLQPSSAYKGFVRRSATAALQVLMINSHILPRFGCLGIIGFPGEGG